MTARFQVLLEDVLVRHPRARRGILEARAVNPSRFDEIAETLLEWAVRVRGADGIARSLDAYVDFTNGVNFAQARYEASGAYEHRSFEEVYASHYSQDGEMDGYLWGIYLTNFLWAHHVELWLQYEDSFLRALAADARIVEIAPGHGAWGVWALHRLPGARLRGYDISPMAMKIAAAVASAAGVGDRAVYEERDALELGEIPAGSADACICCFLVEHLERPDRLFSVIHRLLRDGGRAFVTGALTAAQVDHIFEFRKESELVLLAEASGLRLLESKSVNPRRLLTKARFVPRSMSLILEKR
jgi:SAM-dependent methyltransferase